MTVHALENTWINGGKRRMNLEKKGIFIFWRTIEKLIRPFSFLA
jgi:hypothetical protein